MADNAAQSKTDKKVKIQPDINLKNELDVMSNKYFRILADYQNLEKRFDQQREAVSQSTKAALLMKFLTIFDDIENAQIFISDKGLSAIRSSFTEMLKKEGLVEIDVLGKPFDPLTSEVIEVVGGDKDNVVSQVLRKGFMFMDKVLRVAQVKVMKKIIQK